MAQSNTQAPYHVIPDLIKGGWNVYTTNAPQEPQIHFKSREDAVEYARKQSGLEGVAFVVEESEAATPGAPSRGAKTSPEEASQR